MICNSRRSKFALRSFAQFALLFVVTYSPIACGGGGMSAIGISPNTTQVLDAGQSLALQVSVVNDPTHQGATFAVTGGGTISNAVANSLAGSTTYTLTYTAPNGISAQTTATVTATSVASPTQKASVTVTVNPALSITTTTLAVGTAGAAYSATIATTGGTAPVKFAIASGTLPTGLGLSATTGVISGTPSAFGTFSFSITATDATSAPGAVTQSYTLTINPTAPTVTTNALANAVAGTAYSQQLASIGGNGSAATWTVASDSLPTGLSLSASGLVSGTPAASAAGTTFTFGVIVAIGSQASVTKTLSITVISIPVVTTTALPSGNISIPYGQQLTFTGGDGSAPVWAIVAGSLPSSSGLTLSANGLLSGTPTGAATYSFSVAVTVGTQASVAKAFTLTVNSLIVTSGSTALGEVGLPFVFQLKALGGTGPYTWSLATGSNALPAGLTLNTSTGVISGSPTTAAGSPLTGVTVLVTDALGATATQSMTFAISVARSSAHNNALSGQYAFLLSGFDAAGKPMTFAGSFTADGNGNLTAGVGDTNGTGLAAPAAYTLTSGSYSIGDDYRGKIVVTSSLGTSTFTVGLNSLSSGVAGAGTIISFDASGNNLTGTLALQTPSAFTAASLAGGFAFGLNGFAANSNGAAAQHRVTVGELQLNGAGALSSGELLNSNSGGTTPTTVSSGTIVVAANGRAALTLVLPGSITQHYAAYVISAKKLFLVSLDPSGAAGTADLLSGSALGQTIANGSFVLTSLNSTAAVRLERLNSTVGGAPVPDAQLGLYTFTGTGQMTLSSAENAGGVVTTNSLGGGYSIASNGRFSYHLASGLGGCTDCVGGNAFGYLVGANQGFLLDLNNPVSNGYFEPQTGGPFSAASLAGSATAGSIEPLSTNAPLVSAEINASGSGTLTGKLDQNASGTLLPDISLTGTYSTAANGRSVVSTTAGNSVLYLVSPTKALLLDTSSGTPVIQELIHQ